MRQQQQLKGTSINMSKQTALLNSFKRPIGNGEFVKDGFISMATFGVNEYERNESPVSVISHSATIVSQPSSACTSMEHQFNHHISDPNSNHRQRIAFNPNHECPFPQSMGTSGASTSEDDSSANYDISTMFIAVPPKQEDLSQQAQQHAAYSKGILRKSTNDFLSQRVAFTHQTSAKALNRSSSHVEADRVTDSYNSDYDDQMISIDFSGLQEEPMVLRENFLKSYGNKPTVEDQKHEAGATLKQKEEYIKLNRSTSNAHKEIIVARPFLNLSAATKVVSHANSNPRKEAPLNVGKHEEEPLKGPLKLAKPSNTIPSLISRQRSLNSAKLGVPSKWDDAEKWLCYDNHQLSHFNKSSYRQTLHSIPSSGGKMFGANKGLNCIEDYASPNRGGLNVKDKAFECRSGLPSVPSRGKLNIVSNARECTDNVALGVVANCSLPQGTNLKSGRVDHSSIDATSGGNHACASQSSSSDEVVEDLMLAYGYLDTLKRKWNEVSQVKAACEKDVSDYLSSGEIAKPHLYALHQKLAEISMSDGELNRQVTCRIASLMSTSTGSMPGEMKAKVGIRPASTRNGIRSKSDALGTPCTCDYSSSGGETMSTANQQNVASGICSSDGEVCENYASGQQFKSKGSYTQRFKQHQILQKLRRKCSPRKGAYAITASGKAVEEEEVGGHTAMVNACLQTEFVVQTPTHGRSASMKDACTEVSPSLSRRDIGTQMTPPASSPITPKCTTPLQNTSPARHNTPTRASPTLTRERNDVNFFRDDDDGMSTSVHRISRCDNGSAALELESCHWAKLELREPPSGAQTSERNGDLGSVCNDWSPGYGLEEEIVGKDGDEEEGQCAQDEVNSGAIMVSRAGALEARAAAWEEAERAKLNAKFKREEARIKAWENLQKAKAEGDLKKLEVKLERLRSKATEKVLNRVATAQKRADEMRAAAEAQQAEQMRKMREKACNLRKNALFRGSFAVCFARNYMP